MMDYDMITSINTAEKLEYADDFRHSFFIYPKFSQDALVSVFQDDYDYLHKVLSSTFQFLIISEDTNLMIKEYIHSNTYVGEYCKIELSIAPDNQPHITVTDIIELEGFTFRKAEEMKEHLIQNENITIEETIKGINSIEMRFLKYGKGPMPSPDSYLSNPFQYYEENTSSDFTFIHQNTEFSITSYNHGYNISMVKENEHLPCIYKIHPDSIENNLEDAKKIIQKNVHYLMFLAEPYDNPAPSGTPKFVY